MIAAEFRPGIALLDIGMPGQNGYEVARELRATERGRSIVLVAITGWGHEDDRRQAEAAGFDHHRAKPVDLDALTPLFDGSALGAGTVKPRRGEGSAA